MAAEKKLTNARLKRMLALLEQGDSARSIASSLGVGHVTVLRWMQEKKLESKGRPGAPRKAVRGAEPEPAPPLTLPDLAAEVAKAEAAMNEPNHSLSFLKNEAAHIEVFIRQMREDMFRGEATPASYEHLHKLLEKISLSIEQKKPSVESDPNKDPAKIKAATELVQRAEQQASRLWAEQREEEVRQSS